MYITTRGIASTNICLGIDNLLYSNTSCIKTQRRRSVNISYGLGHPPTVQAGLLLFNGQWRPCRGVAKHGSARA